MRKLLAKDLKIKFIESLNDLQEFSYEDGNPFLIRIKVKQYFVFLKNLSPAYFKNSPDVTRVQLPYSNHFPKILKADIPFIVLGYDVDNDVFVSWNPQKIKERLNAKANVSLYSRESLQKQTKSDDFKDGYLSNGEKIIIFNRGNLSTFFENSNLLFSNYVNKVKLKVSSEPITEYIPDKLTEIVDQELINEIKPLLMKNRVLEAVEICANHYANKYKSMKFKDWFNLVSTIYQNMK